MAGEQEVFKGQTGHGDWADSLLELDTDFGVLLDLLDELDLAGSTLVVAAFTDWSARISSLTC